MAAPDNAAELLPVTWQVALAALTLLTTVGGVIWKFLDKFKSSEPVHDQHVVLERAELADLSPLREFMRDFRPALERLSRIDASCAQMAVQIDRVLDKLYKMERDAQVAKEVREELARRTDQLERQSQRRRHDRDDD